MNDQIEKVTHDGELICMILRGDYRKDGVEFFTPPDFSQQLAYMQYDTGKKIDPHIHRQNTREVYFTLEVLIIRKGVLKVFLYTKEKKALAEKILYAGDIILLCSGGHGFEVLESLEMVEVKQGPYSAEDDKIRFFPEGWL